LLAEQLLPTAPVLGELSDADTVFRIVDEITNQSACGCGDKLSFLQLCGNTKSLFVGSSQSTGSFHSFLWSKRTAQDFYEISGASRMAAVTGLFQSCELCPGDLICGNRVGAFPGPVCSQSFNQWHMDCRSSIFLCGYHTLRGEQLIGIPAGCATGARLSTGSACQRRTESR